MTNKFDVVSIYVAYANITGGKRRPVLILGNRENALVFFSITTKYASKSKFTKGNYYKILKWHEIGLNSQSYVDTGTVISLDLKQIDSILPIGNLSDEDILGLNSFLAKK